MQPFIRLSTVITLGYALSFTAQTATLPSVDMQHVRAHEEFLASDVLAGRGSATRDEQIAATYVASQFMSYGLTPVPGFSSYLQSAELMMPLLDATVSIRAGEVTFKDESDFEILRAANKSYTGPFAKLAFANLQGKKLSSETVLLVTDVPDGTRAVDALNAGKRTGAGTVMTERDDEIKDYVKRMAERKVRPYLRDVTDARASVMIALSSKAAARMAAVKEGQSISLDFKGKVVPPRETYNAIGYLQGTDKNAGTIMLTAHLDHLGVKENGKGDTIFNGANDDASGVTAVLELARTLAAGPQPKRSILFVCYGSEEFGALGSLYFSKRSPIALKEIVANIEFEMVGVQDPKMKDGYLLFTGWERSNLGPTLTAHGAHLGPILILKKHFFQRSDNYMLALEGVVAHTAAGWGTVPTYHRVDDDLAHIDLHFMTTAIQSLVEPIRWLASSDFVPAWNKDGQPHRE